MRKLPLARLVLSFAALIGGVCVWVACGDDDAAPGTISPVPDGSSPDGGGNGEVDSGNGGETDSGGQKDTGAPDVAINPNDRWDAGPPVVLDGGSSVEGGVPCVVGGQLEDDGIPGNDSKGTANRLNPTAYTRCGQIQRDLIGGPDAGASESDWLTFGLDAGSTEFYVQYQGNVTVKLEWDGGGPVDITQNPSPNVPMVKGYPYYAQVQSKDGKPQKWRVTLFQCAGALCPPK